MKEHHSIHDMIRCHAYSYLSHVGQHYSKIDQGVHYPRSKQQPHGLGWYDWRIQLDLSAAATEPRRFFRKPLHTAVVAIWDRF